MNHSKANAARTGACRAYAPIPIYSPLKLLNPNANVPLGYSLFHPSGQNFPKLKVIQSLFSLFRSRFCMSLYEFRAKA